MRECKVRSRNSPSGLSTGDNLPVLMRQVKKKEENKMKITLKRVLEDMRYWVWAESLMTDLLTGEVEKNKSEKEEK